MEVPVKKQTDRGDVEQASDRPTFVPLVNIYETDAGVTVEADLPGVKKEDIALRLEEGVLTLSGKVDLSLPEGVDPVYREFEVGDFYRSFRLGPEVDGEKVDATLEDGVLHLRIPKSDWAKTKKIEVK